MKTIKITEAYEYDMNLIMIYEDKRLTGVNYSHGAGDYDDNYLKNDPELFNILKQVWAGTKRTLIEDLIEAIHIKIDQETAERDIETKVNEIFATIRATQERKLKVHGKDLMQEDHEYLNNAEAGMRKYLKQFIK